MVRSPVDCRPTRGGRRCLRLELLETRDVPSAGVEPPFGATIQPTVLAGDSQLGTFDAAVDRIDPNTRTSPFAGVGSLLVTTRQATFLGTASAISRRHVLTAAHVVDVNNDGKVNGRDGLTGVYFILNFGEDQSHRIAIERFHIHPHFTGFNRPAVNDDIAVLTLAEELPEDLPIYRLPESDLALGTLVTMVGYGRSGDGVNGYRTAGSVSIKRVGENVIDALYGQDDRRQPYANEVLRFDFDGPVGNGPLGGPSLGLDREAQLGTGDSGGPSLVRGLDGWVIVGVNSFIQGPQAPLFGSMGGAMNVFAYRRFIFSVLNPSGSGSSELPSLDSLVPGLGPITNLPKPGIRVGAIPVSGEIDPIGTAAPIAPTRPMDLIAAPTGNRRLEPVQWRPGFLRGESPLARTAAAGSLESPRRLAIDLASADTIDLTKDSSPLLSIDES